MTTIRKQSIISSALVYIGFALGFLNTYLFAREGGFTQEQYGLTGIFVAIANVMFSFAQLGMLAYIYKFFPYYRNNLPPEKNDMITLALLTSLAGFVMVMLAGVAFKDFVIKKYGTNSPELVKYYYWLFPFGFGLTMYSLLEAFAWQLGKSVLTTFLKEILFRIITTTLILLSFAGVLGNFSVFIKIYACTYLVIAVILLAIMIGSGQMHITTSLSRVTKKFFKKILALISFVWGGSLVYNIAIVFDTIVIAAVLPNGLKYAGIFTLAQNMSSLIQAPQRAIISASIGPLSQAWKDKDFAKINRIYHRSSINQLVFSAGMFVLIWINFTDGILTFHLQKGFLEGKDVFLYIGLMRIIDMGTGVNSQIIGTSNYWRFEFITGVILLAMTLPLNYILAKNMGVVGPAIANLFSLTIYNAIRYTFLFRKFKMQPFNARTLYTLVTAAICFVICYLLFNKYTGIEWLILRSVTFLALYIGTILSLNISPDIVPVLKTVKKRLLGTKV
jgi:O-antigen/teichoic acid export membrane protein